ncbi:MAG: type II toxin-antitoxin system VapC family toxin [Planctomycetes bacterium]|nr:type II toxin-antitoxin system VapC family toxin [Planctomycetota bacterium]
MRYRNDAAHVAVAVWHRMDVVVSWNMEHLVKVSRIERFNQVNAVLGLPPIRIHTPEEVIDL